MIKLSWQGESDRHGLSAKGIFTGRRKRLKSFVKEEKQTAKLYRKMGFKKQAAQEKQHARFFELLLKKSKSKP